MPPVDVMSLGPDPKKQQPLDPDPLILIVPDALKQISRAGGDMNKVQRMFENAPKFRSNPDAVELAKKLYEEYG